MKDSNAQRPKDKDPKDERSALVLEAVMGRKTYNWNGGNLSGRCAISRNETAKNDRSFQETEGASRGTIRSCQNVNCYQTQSLSNISPGHPALPNPLSSVAPPSPHQCLCFFQIISNF